MIKKIFLRDGLLYLIIVGLVFLCIDVSKEKRSIELRKINDAYLSVDVTQLYKFSLGQIDASAVDWKKLYNYFHLTVTYLPNQVDAEMFMAYCEYYGFADEDNAVKHFYHSAKSIPSYFWNLYDTGVILVKNGDVQDAIPCFEMALMLHVDRAFYYMFNSVLYRQLLGNNWDNHKELLDRFNLARERCILFLAAGFYDTKDYDDAELFAMKGAYQADVDNREPFYFYAGAVEMAKGRDDQALQLFDKAIQAKSKNAWVYLYAADILKKKQHLQESQRLYLIGKSLQQDVSPPAFTYPQDLDLRLF